MSEGKRDSPHGNGPYGEPAQRDFLGGIEVPGGRRSKRRVSRARNPEDSFFDHPPMPAVRLKPVVLQQDEAPIIRTGADYFKGRELPADVWAPSGVAYYERLEDIPTVLFPKTDKPPKIAGWENRAAVALQVCPPGEGEPADSSFRIVGDRGLYVRVILGEMEEKVGEVIRKKPIIRWMHYNEEAAAFKNIRYT